MAQNKIPMDICQQMQKLKQTREALGLSHRLLAGILGVGHSTISYWETGRKCPNDKHQKLISAWLQEVERKEALPDLGRRREATERCDQLKHLLNLLEFHLRYFQDGLPETREVYRQELDVYDVGYLTSLLEMLFDEGKFQRWKVFTTHRFGGFRGKQHGRKGKDKGEYR